ncbi:unnamed protein product [Didymodactylos carnosus]|uniref:28S ribosomal protein S18b, mitochondrial n=1 Tax=Didymodactylos carnosus TaxID=1234261 RepID=A0A814DNW2_9BILA|nr:unnamed protein product [Didymodactylos carnosus]CAF1436751.1 unnamed protein product [Didymodactylos carnosus]CAF3731997.1 unnamed protein product [Didymodactylos carnosus]CAF4233848.1 unnamed protein product [Didymodactylos carnosus]
MISLARLFRSTLCQSPARLFSFSAIRHINWEDIDEYTNKVNQSVFLTTDVYEKDDEWVRYDAKRKEKLRKEREHFLSGPPKRKTPPRSPNSPLCSSMSKNEEVVDYNPNDDQPKQMNDPYLPEPHKCIFCVNKLEIDFRNVELLSQFISPQTGFIFNQRTTGLCYFKQIELEKAIWKSRRFHLMPYYWKETVYLDDPKLFNPYDNNLKKVTNAEREKFGL